MEHIYLTDQLSLFTAANAPHLKVFENLFILTSKTTASLVQISYLDGLNIEKDHYGFKAH